MANPCARRAAAVFMLLSAFSIAGCTMLGAVDLSGKWTLKMDRDFRGNPSVPVECTFNQRGSDLSVNCGTSTTMKGEVHGGQVKWGWEKKGIAPMIEDKLVLTYIGQINETGTAIRGTWQVTSAVLNEKGTFAAEK